MELWAAHGEHGAPYPDRARPTGVTTGCVRLQERAELPSRKQKEQPMMSPTETTRTPEENPRQPDQAACMRSASFSLRESLTNLMRGLVCFSFELTEICLKAVFIFLFVILCALFIFFLGDYIFCNSAHTERFGTILNIIAHCITAQGVLFFVVLYGIASRCRRFRTDLDSVASITVGRTQTHTPD